MTPQVIPALRLHFEKDVNEPGSTTAMTSRIRRLNTAAIAALFSTVLLCAFQVSGASELFELVSPGEAQDAIDNPAPEDTFQTKGAIGAPVIKILSPTVDTGELVSPVDIEMAFESPDNTAIDMSSLKILYVMMIKKDVTDRILEHATINDARLVAKGAKLPKGNHKFIVEIQDDKKRKTREKFSVSVSE